MKVSSFGLHISLKNKILVNFHGAITSIIFDNILLLTGCSLLGSDSDPFKISGKLVFTVVDNTNNRQLFSMNANGTVLQQLTQIGDDEQTLRNL